MRKILFCTLLCPVWLHAQQPLLDRFIDSCSSGLQTPGGVLSMEQDGKLVYERAFGAATLEFAKPITPNTIFEAGSVSKQFTAAAVLLLVTDGKLNLTDDIRQFITELPDYKTLITVEHLLSHTSGLKDWGTIAQMGGWPRTTTAYTEAHVQRMLYAQRSLNFTPGTQYAYSNSNHNLLRLLVERVSKKSFTLFTKEYLFAKAGMNNTQWRTSFRELVPGRAVAYKPDSTGFEQDMPFENTYGHAALLTTTKDLLAWNRFLVRKGFGEKFETLRLKKWEFSNGAKGTYGYGALFLRNIHGLPEIAHSGSTAGYRAWLAYYPEKKLSVAYLSNHAGIAPVAVARVVTKAMLNFNGNVQAPKANPQRIGGSAAAAHAGIYRSKHDPVIIELVYRGDTMYMQKDPSWNPRYNDPLLLNERNIVLQQDGALKVTTTAGVQLFHKKDKPSTLQPEIFTGNFYSAECRGKVSIIHVDGQLQLKFPSGEIVPLHPLYEDNNTVAFISPNNILLEFERPAGKEIQTFRASLSQEQYAFARADNLIFKRTR